MTAFRIRTSTLAAAIAAASVLFFPSVARADSNSDVSAALRAQHINVSRLNLTQAEGITLLKGQVTRREDAARAANVVRGLGYARVANMIRVVPVPDDELLALQGERMLALTRSLDGCALTVNSENGIVTVSGTVHSDLQGDVAVQLLRRLKGVKSVRSDISRI